MSDCLFCNIATGEIPGDIVYEDDLIVVFKDIYPKAEVHLLMIPRKHIISLADVDETDSELLAYMLNKVKDIAHQQGLTGGFRTIINTGRDGGQIIFHLHIHILGGKNLPGF